MLIVALLSVGLSITLILAGSLVLLRNHKDLVNRSFFYVAIVSALWSLTFIWSYYLFAGSVTKSTIAWLDLLNKITYFLGLLLLVSVVDFTFHFPRESNKKYLYYFWLISVPTLIMSVTPPIAGNVVIKDGEYVFSFGTMVWLYVLVMLTGVLIIVRNLLRDYRQLAMAEKQQSRLLLFGFSTSIIIGITFAVVVPVIAPEKNYDVVSPFALFFFIVPVAIAIGKNKLFDIRLVIARSLGYVLSIAVVVLATAFVIFGLSTSLINLGVDQQIRLWLYVFVTLFFSLLYQPLKRLFDNITNKLFYRDAYETQTFLNEFNQVIVSTIDLNQLLVRAGATIEKYLKPDSVSFAIRDSDADTVRIISGTDTKVPKEAIEQMRAYVHDSSEKLFATDVLDESQKDLKQLLQETNIGLFARITTNLGVEGNGYIIMGYKKSGNMYNSQDIGAMEIVSNELAIAMQNALQFDEIQKFAVTLQEKVDDATRKLRRSNEKLKQMDETKDEFISMASHQLRTPLTSVKGYVSMVIEGDAGDLNPMQKKLLDQAFVSSQRMVYLIADLLNVSRLRTGKFVIDSAPTNLADVVQGEVEQLIETAAGRGLELTYEKPKDFPTLMMDETKIRQVVMNFIDNAIYYTPHGGHIIVSLKDTGKTIEYAIIDDGLGVPKSQQHHLFSKFFRADNAKKARPDGTGLGLFMAKKVIVAQGGSIIFKSTEGKGSTFGFSFDKAKLAVPDHFEAKEPLNGIKFGPTPSPDK